MKYDPNIYHRRSIRLKGYDYSRSGAYFITICTHNRRCLFGEVVNDQMRLNEAGHIADQCWRAIPDHFPRVQLDEYVIMPNHIHGIIVITVGAKNLSPLHQAKNLSPLQNVDFSPLQSRQSARPTGTSRTVGSIVRGFKIGVTKWFRTNGNMNPIWQRNYYEHIIRDERSLNWVRQYIRENPLRWHLDPENPYRMGHGTNHSGQAMDVMFEAGGKKG